MLGDWIEYDSRGTSIRGMVSKLYYDYNGRDFIKIEFGPNSAEATQDCFIPIPLTTEILEKSGFEQIRQDAANPYYWQFFDKEEGHVINAFRRIYRGLWIECSNATTETSVNKQCEYVHELQHALRLAGIKKEIVL